jgi:para-nitrobenzyl esterase
VRWFAAAGVPVYLYRYMRAPNILQRSQGAFHGAELVSLFPSVFASHGWIHEPDDDVVTNVLVGYWSRFAATGDPNGSGALAWPRYEARSDPYMALDVTPHVGTGLRAAQCDVWDHVNK